MKTTYECKGCHKVTCEVQHPSDEYERDLELCCDCRKSDKEKIEHGEDRNFFKNMDMK